MKNKPLIYSCLFFSTLWLALHTAPSSFGQSYSDTTQTCPPGKVFKTTPDDPVGRCHCIGNPSNRTQKLTAGKGYLGGCSTTHTARTTTDFTSVNGTNGFYFLGRDASENLGSSMFGDINGDNIDDLIVASYSATPPETGRNASGAIYVIFGQNGNFPNPFNLNSLDGRNGFIILGADTNAMIALDGVGDINGDGFDDIITSMPDSGCGCNQAEMFVTFGKATQYWNATVDLATLTLPNGFRFIPENGGTFSPQSSARIVGDVNRDGYNDILIADIKRHPSFANGGSAWIVFGKALWSDDIIDLSTIENGTDASKITAQFDLMQLGRNQANQSKGFDMNGDGYDDILLAGSLSHSHRQYLIFGKEVWPGTASLATFTDGTQGVEINTPHTASLATASYTNSMGDVNGDGYDDMLISVPWETASGEIYLIFGKASGWTSPFLISSMSATDGVFITGPNEGNGDGMMIDDIDKDGYADILTMRYLSYGPKEKAFSLIYGRSHWPASLNISSINGANGYNFSQGTTGAWYWLTHNVGDINNDGFNDMPFISYDSDGGFGRVNIIYGTAP